jgi:hypothetical protein
MSEPRELVGSQDQRQPVNALEAEAIATLGYIYGYPLVLMDVMRAQAITPANQFAHTPALPDDAFRDAASPDVDTLSSRAWLDVGREPIVLAIPDMGRRYYAMQVLDAWTNVFAAPGTRTTGNGRAAFAIMGPGWRGEVPSTVDRMKSPTSLVCLIGRTYTAGVRDYDAVHALQRQFQLVPLGAWGKSPGTPRGGRADVDADVDRDVDVDADVGSDAPPVVQVEKLGAGTFFARLARLMKANPPAENDEPIVRRLARLGIAAGAPFDPARLPASVADAVDGGVAAARARLSGARLLTLGNVVNGWRIALDLGRYGTNYEQRAIVALAALGANLPDDAIHPTADVDAAGLPLGGQHRYLLRFSPGMLPPVKAFWSVTMYGEDQFLVENPIGRHALGDRDPMRADPDGTLDMFIQHDDPGPDRRSNWLPAPAGAFNLMMRLHYPKPPVLEGAWSPPAIVRV